MGEACRAPSMSWITCHPYVPALSLFWRGFKSETTKNSQRALFSDWPARTTSHPLCTSRCQSCAPRPSQPQAPRSLISTAPRSPISPDSLGSLCFSRFFHPRSRTPMAASEVWLLCPIFVQFFAPKLGSPDPDTAHGLGSPSRHRTSVPGRVFSISRQLLREGHPSAHSTWLPPNPCFVT